MSHLHKILRLRIGAAINFTSKYSLMAKVYNFIYGWENIEKLPLSHLASELWYASILSLKWQNRKWNPLTVLQYMLSNMLVTARNVRRCKNVDSSKQPTNKPNAAELLSKTFRNPFEKFST